MLSYASIGEVEFICAEEFVGLLEPKRVLFPQSYHLGGFPNRFLYMLQRLSFLTVKRIFPVNRAILEAFPLDSSIPLTPLHSGSQSTPDFTFLLFGNDETLFVIYAGLYS